MTAYEKVGPKDATFHQLASTAAFANDIELLAELVQAHQKTDKDSVELVHWRGELHWLRKDYVKALDQYLQFQKRRKEPESYEWQVVDRIFRCQIRLKRFADAERALNQAKEPEASVRRAAVAAASGDVKATEAMLDRLAENNMQFWFYTDPDLGPALRTEPFQKIRQKYPEPKNQGGNVPLEKT